MGSESLAREILELLTPMNHEAFVRMIVDHLDLRRDFEAVRPGPPRGEDSSVDIVARLRGPDNQPKTVCLQCKRYSASSSLAKGAVHDTLDGLLETGADVGILVSTRFPTPDAQRKATLLRNDGYDIRYEDWCGTGLAKTLCDLTPSVLHKYFPSLRGKLPVAHEWEPLCPSFEIVSGNATANSSAERFYNGFPPTWGDLASSHDIERFIYEQIRHFVEKYLRAENATGVVRIGALLGVAGTGKTTLLRRAGFDAARKGIVTLRLKDDWKIRPVSLAMQIQDVARESRSPILVLVDNAAELVFEHKVFEGTLRELQDTAEPVSFLIAEESGAWRLARARIPYLTGYTQVTFTLHDLLDSECQALVDRILQYELSGAIRSFCTLGREERLNLIQSWAGRQLVVAMLQMRHGEQFKSILQTEYDRVPATAAKHAYGMVCYLAANYGIRLPQRAIWKAIGVTSPLQIQEFIHATDDLLVDDGSGLGPRHSVIGRIVARHAFPSVEARAAVLTEVVSVLQPDNIAEEQVFLGLVTGDRQHRKMVFSLDRNPEVVRDVYRSWLTAPLCQIRDLRKRVFAAYGLAERLLGNPDAARKHFGAAIDLHPQYAFALRQWAWLEQAEGNWQAAAVLACRSADSVPQDFATQLQCAQILMFNTVDNFQLARQYFERARALDPESPHLQKLFERYEDAGPVDSHLRADNMLPTAMIAKLRPGLAQLRALHGSESKEVRNRLTRDLQNLEEREHVEIEDLHEMIADIPWEKDRSLAALVDCNLARCLYWQWYHQGQPHEPDHMELLFKRSLSANPKDPFTHCWYGTFLKEVKENFEAARNEYDRALQVAKEKPGSWMDRHPLFLNNMALLLMDEYRAGRAGRENLVKAKKLLNEAVKSVEERKSDFSWPSDSLSLCLQLMEEQRRSSR